jgi:hypothetical protein
MAIATPRRPRGHSRSITERPGVGVDAPASRPPLPPPAKIKKSDIRPPDPSAPAMRQFSETVKRSASYLLKTIGVGRPELRPVLNRAFATFFRSFDAWMAAAGRTSQRKLNEPPPSLSLLERTLSECTESLAALRSEVRLWMHTDPRTPGDAPRAAPDEFCGGDWVPDADLAVAGLVEAIAAERARRRGELRKLERLCNQVFNEFQSQLTIDFAEQVRVCDVLR